MRRVGHRSAQHPAETRAQAEFSIPDSDKIALPAADTNLRRVPGVNRVMGMTLEKLARSTAALGGAQLLAVALALGAFFVFYVALANSLFIATFLALLVGAAVWQLVVSPLYRKAAELAAHERSQAAGEKLLADLTRYARQLPDTAVRVQVSAIAEHFRYALQLQRSTTEPLARITAQGLTDVALGSTLSVVKSYHGLATRRRTAAEQSKFRQTETFLGQLAAALEAQTSRLHSLAAGGTGETEADLETNVVTLQIIFDIPATEEHEP